MEIGGDWRKKKEEEQLEPLGAVVMEWKLVGWLVGLDTERSFGE